MKRLTEIAHDLVRDVLKPGDVAIDATAGNGHDTLFLAEIVGDNGCVYAFDIQDAAIESTRVRAPSCVKVIQANHSDMERHTLPEHRHRIACVMFNLGYLPGGDKSIITKPDTTRLSIEAALRLLKPGGILTVMTYPGHAGGSAEDRVVSELLKSAARIEVSSTSPKLYWQIS